MPWHVVRLAFSYPSLVNTPAGQGPGLHRHESNLPCGFQRRDRRVAGCQRSGARPGQEQPQRAPPAPRRAGGRGRRSAGMGRRPGSCRLLADAAHSGHHRELQRPDRKLSYGRPECDLQHPGQCAHAVDFARRAGDGSERLGHDAQQLRIHRHAIVGRSERAHHGAENQQYLAQQRGSEQLRRRSDPLWFVGQFDDIAEQLQWPGTGYPQCRHDHHRQ